MGTEGLQGKWMAMEKLDQMRSEVGKKPKNW